MSHAMHADVAGSDIPAEERLDFDEVIGRTAPLTEYVLYAVSISKEDTSDIINQMKDLFTGEAVGTATNALIGNIDTSLSKTNSNQFYLGAEAQKNIGNMNAITYKEIFPLIKDNKMWVGSGFNMSLVYKTPYPNLLDANRKFVIAKGFDPNEGYLKVPAICWFTNLEHKKRHEELELYKKYTSEEYPKYDNYNAINIDKVSEIPEDYYGKMGVPVTFLHKYNPDQFEIVDALNRYALLDTQNTNEYVRSVHSHTCNINGVPTYFRIVIRRK